MDPDLLKLDFKTTLLALSDMALPRVCVVCGRRLLLTEHVLCLCCESDLPLTRYSSLVHNPMAQQYNSRIMEHITRYEPFQYAVSLFHYREGTAYAALTPALKYGRNFAAGRRLARMLAEQLAQSPCFDSVDAIVPVPLHWRRRLSRGYNQADIIGREVQRVLHEKRGVRPALLRHLLLRVHHTRSQATIKSADGKAVNLSHAFAVSRRRKAKYPAASHILLIDDVFTTGSTASACHDAMRKAYGPSVRISVATLASVE